jgi:glycosyltransferase 2 family protein
LIGTSWKQSALGVAVTVTFLAIFLLRTDLKETTDAIASADHALLVCAMLFFTACLSLQALRWRLLLSPMREIKATRLIPVIFVGHLANNVLPLRIGELVRAMVLGQREHVGRIAALGTITVERLIDGLTLVLILFIALTFHEETSRLRNLSLIAGGAFGLFAGLLVVGVIWKNVAVRALHILTGVVPLRWRTQVRELGASFLTGLDCLRHPKVVAGAVFYTASFWGLITLVYFLVGEAFGIEESLTTYLLVVGAANAGVSIPSSQGGLGPFEFFAREALVLASVDGSVATAYALTLHFLMILPTVILGLFFLWSMKLSFKDLLSTTRTKREDPAVLPETKQGIEST